MKLKLLMVVILCVAFACVDTKQDQDPIELYLVNQETPSYLAHTLETDKSIYKPGEQVNLSLSLTELPDGLKVRYMYLNKIIEEAEVSDLSWTWIPPIDDFKGYTSVVYSVQDPLETVYATVGIDVSSDWVKFPRYGFLSDFGQKTDEELSSVINTLNQYHINSIQFYDWHNKHHQPLPISENAPLLMWKDIMNRSIYFETVDRYIQMAHNKNMAAMFYNLINGAWANASSDGVKESWYAYKDATHQMIDFHPLSRPFLSDIYLLDPSNTEWQSYQSAELENVYKHLQFDGFHMDQLGNRGALYNFNGEALYLESTFQSFIDKMKNDFPSKKCVMNAVNQYGVEDIAQSQTEVLYTEVWHPNTRYDDLANIIMANSHYSDETKPSILAAYMNYDQANTASYFNTPAVLLTDAVIFSFGGAHLELGEHMLCQEYFPNNSLEMKSGLRQALPKYYDFMVSYQNLLRDGGELRSTDVESADQSHRFTTWPPEIGSIATITRAVEQRQVIHFINFSDANTLNWRDNDANQSVPALRRDLEVEFQSIGEVLNVWMASPDVIGGAPMLLNHAVHEGHIYVTIPELKYWTMLVVEYQ